MLCTGVLLWQGLINLTSLCVLPFVWGCKLVLLAGVLIKLNILCLHKPCKAVCMTLCRRGCKFANLHSALMTITGQF